MRRRVSLLIACRKRRALVPTCVVRPLDKCQGCFTLALASALSAVRHVKNKLRELRASRHWSQAELGARLAVSRQTVNAIETGKYDPSLPLAFKIARLFGRPIEEIFAPEKGDSPPSGRS